jgi:8-oxo-dGTP pyrophosphatase MutT (NUDIX family)
VGPGPTKRAVDRLRGTENYAVASSAVTHRGVLTTMRVDTVHTPDGSTVQREVAERPNAVAMVPLTADNEVVMVRQYRHPVGRYELEIPAGLLDVEGEREEDAAQRELAEEIGMTAGTLREVLCFHNSSGWSDEATTVFVATGLRPAQAGDFAAEAEEADMSIHHVPLDDAVAAVHRGEIRDAKTVIGLLLVATERAS